MSRQKILKFSYGLFGILPFVYGGFYDWGVMIYGMSLIVCFYLLISIEKKIFLPEKKIIIEISFLFLCYIGTIFNGVDRGISTIGIVRILVVLIFFLYLYQMKLDERLVFLYEVPTIGAIMTIVSVLFFFTPWSGQFFQASRLGGFFQYSNTFALYLLLGILILFYQKDQERKRKFKVLILITGLILTGSRSVFLLFIVNGIYFWFQRKEERKFLIFLVLFIAILTGCGVLITGGYQNVGRYLTVFENNSTFWGRLLYWLDGVRILLKHPMGLGYLGYYFLQPSVQTGGYTTKFVHNDFLQIGLDAGILAMILGIILFIQGFLSKNNSKLQKHLLLVIGIHSCFDFNLQFLAISMIVVLCMQGIEGDCKNILLKKSMDIILILSFCLFLWMGTGTFLEYCGKCQRALRVNPWLTMSKMKKLSVVESIEEAEQLADDILQQNEEVGQAYSIKAQISYEREDYKAFIKYGRQEIKCQKYRSVIYENYIEKIAAILTVKQSKGEVKEYKKYLQELLWVDGQIRKVNGQTSAIAYKMKDHIQIQIQDHYVEYLNQIRKYYNRHYKQ